MNVNLLAEKRPQARIPGAADRQPGSVSQRDYMAVLGIRLEPGHSLQIHDARAVNAQEVFRIETGFQAGDGLLLQIFLALAGQGKK